MEPPGYPGWFKVNDLFMDVINEFVFFCWPSASTGIAAKELVIRRLQAAFAELNSTTSIALVLGTPISVGNPADRTTDSRVSTLAYAPETDGSLHAKSRGPQPCVQISSRSTPD